MIILFMCVCSILVLQFIVIGDWAGKDVKLEGTVVFKRCGENYTILAMDVDGKLVKVYAPFHINVSVGSKLRVEGKFSWYRGELEVKAKRVD